ncbi:MAG: 23S rRNA (pseudouridine(1915)-N(3))-methyltransferase RlmH [Clostridia bacterium]|nr:23S rRNA (pseudouridine(1915)-N(3))-methyltransferase RlmH [Clostridia bacterium]
MQKITVLSVGNDKESYFTEAVNEYKKRLSRYARTELILLRDEPIPDAPSEREKEEILRREGRRLLDAAPADAVKIALCVEGKQLSSEELSALLEDCAAAAPGVAFFIGGSLGLSEEVKRACRYRLSFSRLTFPHRLMRVILFEALYRAKSIAAGAKYHK